jgi:GT2 family glycosyltransferase
MNKRTLDIIIVNWNAGDQLRDCLVSIELCNKEGFDLSRVIIVDNASVDGSANGLDNLELPLNVIRNTDNRGFGAACNQGARISNADYLLLLNPDTRLYTRSLKVPMEYMEAQQNNNVAVCGIRLVNESGQVIRTCARLPKPGHFFVKMLGLDRMFPGTFRCHMMTEWDHCDSRKVDHVIGAFYLIRKPVFDRLRGFDARFFLYLEDLDLSKGVKDLGYEIHFIADGEAFHRGGGTSESVKATRLFHSLRSRILYGFKHFGKVGACLHFAATILIEPLTRIVLAILHRSVREIKETVQGYVILYRDIPSIIRKIE